MRSDILADLAFFARQLLVLNTKDVVIIILSLFSVLCLLRIRHLRRALKVQEQKALIPVLMLEIDETTSVIYLKNQSSFYAKEISIRDLTLSNLLNFSKPLTFKFERLLFINPQEKAELKYQVFDDRYKIGPSDSQSLIPHLSRAVFEMHLTYANSEGIVFSAILVSDKDSMRVKEIIWQVS